MSPNTLFVLVLLAAPVHSGEPAGGTPDPALQSFVAQRVQVAESRTIFALFAFLNAAGYDDENNPGGMHAVRQRLRGAIDRRLPAELRERSRAFYRAHAGTADPYHYGVVAQCTSGPPDFSFEAAWEEVKTDSSFAALAGLPDQLRAFAGAVPLDSLYEGVRSEYTTYIATYREAIWREVANVMAYCRVQDERDLSGHGEIARMVVIPNLLGSYENAFSFVLGDVFYSIEGPQRRIGYNPHEFVHSITNRMSYDPRYAALQTRAAPLFEAARRVDSIGEEFTRLDAFLDENLVRAIALRYLAAADPARVPALEQAMLREYRSGYILERHFYEGLAGYEKSHATLQEYYPKLFANLDVGRELRRWEDARTVR